MAEMEALVVRINRTNVQAAIPGFGAIMESIARRDPLMTKQRILREICEQSRAGSASFPQDKVPVRDPGSGTHNISTVIRVSVKEYYQLLWRFP